MKENFKKIIGIGALAAAGVATMGSVASNAVETLAENKSSNRIKENGKYLNVGIDTLNKEIDAVLNETEEKQKKLQEGIEKDKSNPENIRALEEIEKLNKRLKALFNLKTMLKKMMTQKGAEESTEKDETEPNRQKSAPIHPSGSEKGQSFVA